MFLLKILSLQILLKNVKVKKKRCGRRAESFRKKLLIAEHRLKSKIGKIFVNEEILEEYSLKIY